MSRLSDRSWLVTALIGAVAFAIGIGIALRQSPPAETGMPGLDTLDSLPAISLPDLQGRLRDSSEWQGKVLVMNFWATWCPPCREEMPMFDALYQDYADQGVVFLGIAIDEAEAVRQFIDETGIRYPVLLGDAGSIDLSRRLGNRSGGLPYTVIFDRTGKLIEQLPGEIKRPQLEARIKATL